MSITLNTPTRGRPLRLIQMYQSALVMADKPDNIGIACYVDEDDIATQATCKYMSQEYNNFYYMVGPRIKLSETHNRLLQKCYTPIVQLAGDDVLSGTKGWDTILEDAFEKIPDKIAYVYGDDGFNKEIGTHGAVHQNWIDAVGYITPPYFAADWSDTWLNNVAAAIGRKQKIDIFIEHMHPSAGKATTDMTYQEGQAKSRGMNLGALYHSTEMRDKRAKDVERLLDFMDKFKVANEPETSIS